MTKKQERHIIASIGTALFMLLVVLLLWLIRLSAVVPEQEEGIEIAFVEETPETGGYPSNTPNPSPIPEDAPSAPSAPAVTQPTPATPPEPILSEEETLAMERARKEKEEREAAERARQQKEAEASAKANAFAGLFGQTGEQSSNTGSSQGNGQKGNPVGHGTSGGNSWNLSGRGIKGTLPKPSNNFKQEGKVVVKIRVNAAGQVIDARETAGGTISDKQTIQVALDAARKAKFTEGDHDQIGTITYIFKIN
jgi:TonB family protein